MTYVDYEPDYTKYSLDELLDAASHVDREKYKERALRIDEQIAKRPQEEGSTTQVALLKDAVLLPNDTPVQALELPGGRAAETETIDEIALERPGPRF